MNLKTLILTTLLTATIPAAAVPQQRVGLVLSGGGAKASHMRESYRLLRKTTLP